MRHSRVVRITIAAAAAIAALLVAGVASAATITKNIPSAGTFAVPNAPAPQAGVSGGLPESRSVVARRRSACAGSDGQPRRLRRAIRPSRPPRRRPPGRESEARAELRRPELLRPAVRQRREPVLRRAAGSGPLRRQRQGRRDRERRVPGLRHPRARAHEPDRPEHAVRLCAGDRPLGPERGRSTDPRSSTRAASTTARRGRSSSSPACSTASARRGRSRARRTSTSASRRIRRARTPSTGSTRPTTRRLCTLDGVIPGPCFPDYPHIGADRNGFYVTTNVFDFFGPNFDGVNIYAHAEVPARFGRVVRSGHDASARTARGRADLTAARASR